MNFNQKIGRRDFIKRSASMAAAVAGSFSGAPFLFSGMGSLVSGCASPKLRTLAGDDLLTDPSPFGYSDFSHFESKEFLGEHPFRAHEVLWDKKQFLSDRKHLIPQKAEKTKLVILGGGLSGLSTAHLLKEYSPILLEYEAQLGGNSKGEILQRPGSDPLRYSIGAAYFTPPEEGSDLYKFLQGLNLHNEFRKKTTEDPVECNQKIIEDFWKGGSVVSLSDKKKILKVYKNIESYSNGKHPFPDIPVVDPSQRSAIDALDRMSLYEWVKSVCGPSGVPSHLFSALEYYCWSSFGGSCTQISAASGLNFYAGEVPGIVVYPGGNAYVAERIYQNLLSSLKPGSIRTQSLVLDVSVDEAGVKVIYLDPKGEIKKIEADYAVCATSKMVASHLIDNLEPVRLRAIEKLSYTSYMVANVLVDQKAPREFYDLFCIGHGNASPEDDLVKAIEQKGVTDLILASYAKPHPDTSVYTLYRPFPSPRFREKIYDKQAFLKYKHEFESQIDSKFLKLLGIAPAKVKGLRISRFGHPMPVAQKNLIADKVVDELIKPFKKRLFFVNQDNWMLPALETVVSEAQTCAKVLGPQLRD